MGPKLLFKGGDRGGKKTKLSDIFRKRYIQKNFGYGRGGEGRAYSAQTGFS